jgi:phage shock protein E
MAFKCFFCKPDNVLSGAEARRMVASGARLLDVRTPEEFASGHIPGALNIPVAQLDLRLGELPTKQQPLVVYCRSGNRSASAARLLGEAGFTAVHDLGAMSRW